MIKFMYSEFSRNVSAYPWRSISFILSFSCTYFILIFSSFGIKNLFHFFENATSGYEVMIILNPNTSDAEMDKMSQEILKIAKPSLSIVSQKPAVTTKNLNSNEVFKYMVDDNKSKSIELSEEDINSYVPKVIQIKFDSISSFKKIILASKIKNEFSSKNKVTEVAIPYPYLHRIAELYVENRFGLFLLMSTLYFSVFILLYLLLTLSLKEHKQKINLFRILGYKKNIIRWPLILEGTFLSLAGFIFAMSAMYSVHLQLVENYGAEVNLKFFSLFEFSMHLILCVSIVFFLTTLLTQKIISDDFIEN